MNPTTDVSAAENLVTLMTTRMATLTRTLTAWMQEHPATLAEIEHHVVRLLKEIGTTLIAGLSTLALSPDHPRSLPCACGHTATYQRYQKAQVTTLLGPITLSRPYYLCAACGHGQHPLDEQLQFCAGSRSAALDELLALLGATQDSFVQAASVLERLTLVHVSANSVRDATENLGEVLLAYQATPQTTRAPHSTLTSSATSQPTRLYIAMDGVLAHLHERGWSEIKVGCCYQTHSRVERKRPEQLEIRAHSASYVTALEQAQTFGWRLWDEALRRGVLDCDEVVVLGDGAHWIWNIAATHFPGATQIVDWYHASEYLWNAASAIWGESSPLRAAWAHAQLDVLWEGKVAAVLRELEQWRERGDAVTAALSYYSTHEGRMDYASYRARGLQIGSGNVESACKQLVSTRLKQAGMIWDAAGAEAVAAVRAWEKSGRWKEAMALRGVRTRSYRRKTSKRVRQEEEGQAQIQEAGLQVSVRPRVSAQSQVLPADVLAQVQAELAEQRGKHVWRRGGGGQGQQEAIPKAEATVAMAA